MKRIGRSGDTIIEVMLALTFLSAVLFTSWAIVNRASQINLAARKRVTMVNQLKEQAEILKDFYATSSADVANKQFGDEVVAAITGPVVSAIPPDPCKSRDVGTGLISPQNAFYFNSDARVASGVKPAITGGTNTEAVWIQLHDASALGYQDFYIRSCWQSGGSQQTDDSSQLIVRLNK